MINVVHLQGRVGKMDSKVTTTGMTICNMSMVTSKRVTKNGEKVEKVTWHNVTLFSKLAEIAQKYVNVGDLLYIQGEIDNQKYTSQDGQERTKHFIVANDLKLMPKSKEHKPEPKQEAPAGVPFEDDDVPW